MPIAPVGLAPLVARSQASAKQVLPLKLPLTHATAKMNGSIPSLVRLSTEVLEKPESVTMGAVVQCGRDDFWR